MIPVGSTTRGENAAKFQGFGAEPVPVTPQVTPYGTQAVPASYPLTTRKAWGTCPETTPKEVRG